MWAYDSLLGKAQTYFRRAVDHPHADDADDDDEFAIWLLLGLEFLLRAPLAKVNPTLLADPTGESILHAAGYPGSAEPKSVPTHTVISRLGRIIDAFTKERQDDATILAGLRNQELHTGAAPLAVPSAHWLPRFTRVVDVVCDHLGVDPKDMLDEVVDQGRALVDAEDRKLKHEVSLRIAASKAFLSGLTAEEVAARRAKVPRRQDLRYAGPVTVAEALNRVESDNLTFVKCPACSEDTPIETIRVRRTREHIRDDEILYEVVHVATGLACDICGLKLSGTAEITAAGLAQQYTKVESESIQERFLSTYEPDFYGND
jgi:hypothetical protein